MGHKWKRVIWFLPVILLLSGTRFIILADDTGAGRERSPDAASAPEAPSAGEASSAAASDGFQELFNSLFSTEREKVVGKNISREEITEFWYTYDSSAYPPDFLRYRFYVEDGAYLFYYEAREGDSWPLTEDDISVSGTRELSEQEWEEFYSCLEGGHVRKREESLEDGDAGPWCYLYWKRDRSEYQEFSFASWEMQTSFEEFCSALKTNSEETESA